MWFYHDNFESIMTPINLEQYALSIPTQLIWISTSNIILFPGEISYNGFEAHSVKVYYSTTTREIFQGHHLIYITHDFYIYLL